MTLVSANAKQDVEPMSMRLKIALLIFYAVAIAVSFAMAQVQFVPVIGGFAVDRWLLVGLGPLAGTVAACLILQQKLPSLFGHNRPVGLLALAAPVVVAAIAGFGNLAGAGLAGLVFGLSIVIYCLCEEIGWRGFLTGNLAWMTEKRADLLTGVMWFAWHFTFMPELRDPSYVFGFTAAIIAGAFGLAEARRRTGGFALATGWHAAVKLFPVGPVAFALLFLMALLTWRSKRLAPAS
jgi:hypothetical protein